jgi:RimJ/RimL family protein N-acetyltransferase
VEVPRLQTERLLLREWREEDLDAYAAMYADPEVMRFLGGPVAREQAWRHLALLAGHWQLRGYGQWVLERREDGRFVGRAGLWRPEGWPGLEVGWTLRRDAWGAGYATEAARAAIAWARETLGADGLISIIDPENAASARVARRLGMAPDVPSELLGKPVVIWRLDGESPVGAGLSSDRPVKPG